MFSDLITGPFMNGLAQYGIHRGSLAEPFVIDDHNPPAIITYRDTSNNLEDDITKFLRKWIAAGLIPPAAGDINTMYFIIPPRQTHIQTYNNASDPIGNGIQGFHNEGVTDPAISPPMFWAIARTDDALDGSFGGDLSNAEARDGGLDFVGGVAGIPNGGVYGMATKVGHELVEQFADRNGSFKELGDPCINTGIQYRGWALQQYWSEWDKSCINGDAPVSLKKFLNAIGFNFTRGLASLGSKTINIDYVASAMQSR
jgi:hypothetical protein